ncbi:MAG TPA: S8 family serine peptidase [Herpetosiphonaceae bacterium]
MRQVLRFAAVLGLVLASVFSTTFSVGPAQAAGTMQTYIVLYKAEAVPTDAAAIIARAGGELVHSYGEIGVVIARSDNAAFRSHLLADSRIENAAATTGFGMRLQEDTVEGGPAGDLPNVPAADGDNLSGLQWDMRQIKTPEAHAITGGSRAVLAGDLDTGLDYRHPDLAPNIDFSKSVSCESGAPNQDPNAWDDRQGHGTHTAGTIAAAANGVGIVGVAPNVRIAAVKTSNDEGYFFPHMVVCAFMWVGQQGFDVVNNSYFADPYLYNCRNEATQRAIWKAEQRAIRFAQSRGVTIFASAGNDNHDMAHPTVDETSPSDGTPLSREITNACLRIPTELPGVITVTAVGNLGQKAYYSDYGVGVIQVTAPGGDRRFQVTPEAPNGRILSTYPASRYNPASPLMLRDCSVSPCGTYAYLQGTSMAVPHATGLGALVVSRFGDAQNAQNGTLRPGQVAGIINQTADPIACPQNPFDPGGTGAFLAECQGGEGYNGFYGHGQINALRAVLHDMGQ